MAHRATEWVFTDPIDFKDAETMSLHGSAFRTLPSPYVVPIALRVLFDDERNGRILAVRYLGEEPISKGIYADGSEIEYGKRTLRPKSIFVSIGKNGTVTDFIAKIDRALDSFKRLHEGTNLSGSAGAVTSKNKLITVKLIKSVIRKYQASLSAPSVD